MKASTIGSLMKDCDPKEYYKNGEHIMQKSTGEVGTILYYIDRMMYVKMTNGKFKLIEPTDAEEYNLLRFRNEVCIALNMKSNSLLKDIIKRINELRINEKINSIIAD